MIKKLRIIFTILSAICIAGVLPIGAIFGFTWAFLAVFGAGSRCSCEFNAST